MHVFDLDDGYFDIMSFMKNLPGLAYHDIRIDYDTGDEHMALFTTTCSSAHNACPDGIVWRVVQIDSVSQESIQSASNCLCRLYSNHISLGHIIVIEQDSRLVTDLIKTFTVIMKGLGWSPFPHRLVLSSEHEIAASATCSDVIAHRLFNCPVKLQNCYYLPMSEKVNCSRVDAFSLQIDFHKPVTATIKVYNLHTNFAVTHSGMLGLRFAA